MTGSSVLLKHAYCFTHTAGLAVHDTPAPTPACHTSLCHTPRCAKLAPHCHRPRPAPTTGHTVRWHPRRTTGRSRWSRSRRCARRRTCRCRPHTGRWLGRRRTQAAGLPPRPPGLLLQPRAPAPHWLIMSAAPALLRDQGRSHRGWAGDPPAMRLAQHHVRPASCRQPSTSPQTARSKKRVLIHTLATSSDLSTMPPRSTPRSERKRRSSFTGHKA